MANRNFLSQKMYSMRGMPVNVDMSFEVDSTDPDGISDLSGPLVDEVLMHSAHATPTQTIAAGVIKIKLQDNYNAMLGMSASMQCANTGSDVKIDNAALTIGVPYTISILGDASQADWEEVGVPEGVEAAVGVSFIAIATGFDTGNDSSSRVQAAKATATVLTVDVMPSPEVAPSSPNQGSEIILICRKHDGTIAAPDDGSKINIQILMNNSSISGE
jgi:hypothetical protein